MQRSGGLSDFMLTDKIEDYKAQEHHHQNNGVQYATVADDYLPRYHDGNLPFHVLHRTVVNPRRHTIYIDHRRAPLAHLYTGQHMVVNLMENTLIIGMQDISTVVINHKIIGMMAAA